MAVGMRFAAEHNMSDAGPVIVGIIGGSGSGKSWLAKRLVELLGPDQAATICQDNFYRDLSHLSAAARAEVNFDHPNALDWAAFRKCLTHVSSGRVARIPTYNFATHTRDREEIILARRPVVIFEGLWLLHRPALRRFFNLSIFIDATSELCLERRIARDVSERGRCPEEVNAWFNSRVLPMQRQFVDPQCWHADFMVCAPVGEAHVSELAQRISTLR
jgi:uridine kinase